MKRLTSEDDLERLLSSPGPVWVFKHSAICPTSSAALQEVERYLSQHEATAAMVVVQEQRPVSNLIARKLGYTHQSPQLFLVEDGRVRWQSSHWGITADAMEQAVAAS
ncbi:MAG: bacillithiol system redox-active protein YtxJ [Planctomycetota bacterium]